MEKMETITAKKLYTMKLPPSSFVVDGLLPKGLHIFAGPPKVGKSRLLLQLALAVASGNSFLGLDTEQGTVLSLCLEDNLSRLQKRVSALTDDPPDTLHLATIAGSLAGGLCDQLVNFLEEHDGTNLIIIDTLQKVRDGTGDGNLYASDYKDVGTLKRIADEYGIALVLVHHLRKREASDPHMMISGTSGLVGAADGSYVLCKEQPGDKSVQLYVRGRDVEEAVFTLEQDSDLSEWMLTSCDAPSSGLLEAEPALRKVVEFLYGCQFFEGTAAELAALLGLEMQPNILSRKIGSHRQELLNLGISFEPNRSGKQRGIRLRHLGNDGMTVSLPGGGVPSQIPESLGNTGLSL